jgi:pimeloyl-ACP methyl ester carboxylesterase
MAIAKLADVELYYEETGQGFPLIWSHEFGGDHRSWEPQVRYFSRRYRVVTYNHRGYAPSAVPKEARAYSQDILAGPCVEPSMMMRGLIPHAGLVVFPGCGHTPNIEEPGLFNLHVSEFLAAVEQGRWAGWAA